MGGISTGGISTDVVEAVQSILSAEPSIGQVYELEPLRGALLSLRCEKQAALYKAREQYRHPKDKELTDFDRKIMLDSYVAQLEADYELLKGLEDLVKSRIYVVTMEARL